MCCSWYKSSTSTETLQSTKTTTQTVQPSGESNIGIFNNVALYLLSLPTLFTEENSKWPSGLEEGEDIF